MKKTEPHIDLWPSKRRVNPLDIQHEDVDINDIAHHLALCNRYAGATPWPLSVAQHSVYVSLIVDSGSKEDKFLALQGLLHDGSEAYLGDVTKWLKATPEMAEYRRIEARTQQTIYERFGCEIVLHPDVDIADQQICAYEMFSFKKKWSSLPGYGEPPESVLFRIGMWRPITWDRAEQAFLARFHELVRR